MTKSGSKRGRFWLSFLIWFLGLAALANIPGWPPLGTLLWTAIVVCGHWYWHRRTAVETEVESSSTPMRRATWSTKNCPECDAHIPLDSEQCGQCGKKQTAGDSTCSGGADREAQDKSWFAQERRRAKRVGSPGYIWRTCRDGAVCERCAANDGHEFSWDVEPRGGHAGARARCRCYPEPIVPLE